MEEPVPESPTPPLITLAQAARRLETEAKALGNVARQHGFFTAVGRDLYFTEEQLKAVDTLLKDRTRAEKKAAARKKKPRSTFGIHESAELRKQRRRDKKRQEKKEGE
ncbi:hypothetical protein GCM10007874_01980 [Labrys miyagiensis]|uniref:Uncharacterized protein n=1 Tax=Labrys miyagiensis TaxID=346912 RepID=A0ABQ6CBY8_9HYPH|nr:hypothetical protein GCM10007874_01980 [Labrys miyagiensis]